jgi:hypothetical protein
MHLSEVGARRFGSEWQRICRSPHQIRRFSADGGIRRGRRAFGTMDEGQLRGALCIGHFANWCYAQKSQWIYQVSFTASCVKRHDPLNGDAQRDVVAESNGATSGFAHGFDTTCRLFAALLPRRFEKVLKVSSLNCIFRFS